jgi:hypothetical protein
MLLALLVCLLGALLYLMPQEEYPKITEIGRIMFAFGLFAFLLLYRGGFDIKF